MFVSNIYPPPFPTAATYVVEEKRHKSLRQRAQRVGPSLWRRPNAEFNPQCGRAVANGDVERRDAQHAMR